jgi:polyphosphate kinase 2
VAKSVKQKKDKKGSGSGKLPDGREKMPRKVFEKELRKLQVELCHLQEWVKHKGLRVVVLFEGRDAAGKGGVIRRITERVSPRVFRVVALPVPSDRQKSQMYLQRYIPHFPAAGEIVLFDRSWYNRAGVERVMGFCTDEQYERFLRLAPAFERELAIEGIILVKYFFDVSQEEQERRFQARITDPLRHWKLSPMDVESWQRWWDYTTAYERMIDATDTPEAPWYRIAADDKRRARLNCIAHLLSRIPYEELPFEAPAAGERNKRRPGVPEVVSFRHEVPRVY